MRIEQIDIEAFGPHALRSFELKGPVTLFYGPNEAGKSTLMAFVRAMWFGFGPLPPGSPAAAPRSGSLVMADRQGQRWRIARHERTGRSGGRSSGGRGAQITLLSSSAGMEQVRGASEQAAAGREADLQAQLGGLTEGLYRSLFAVSLTELQELGVLQSDELSGYLYGAGFGARGGAIAAAERKLVQEMDQLYRPRGRNQPLNQAWRSLDEQEARLRQGKEAVARYNDRLAELSALQQELADSEAALGEARRRLQWRRLCMQARGQALRLAQVEAELAELADRGFEAAAAALRAERLHEEQTQGRRRVAEAADRREALTQQLAQLRPDAELLAQEEALTALRYRAAQDADSRRETARLQEQAERLGEAWRELLVQMGVRMSSIDPGSDEDWLDACRITVAMREQVREAREASHRLQRERERLHGEAEQLQRQLQQAGHRLKQAGGGRETEREASGGVVEADQAFGSPQADRVVDKLGEQRYICPGEAQQPAKLPSERELGEWREALREWQRLFVDIYHLEERMKEYRKPQAAAEGQAAVMQPKEEQSGHSRNRSSRSRSASRSASSGRPFGRNHAMLLVLAALCGLGGVVGLWVAGEPAAAAVLLAALLWFAGMQLRKRPAGEPDGTDIGRSVQDEAEAEAAHRFALLAEQLRQRLEGRAQLESRLQTAHTRLAAAGLMRVSAESRWHTAGEETARQLLLALDEATAEGARRQAAAAAAAAVQHEQAALLQTYNQTAAALAALAEEQAHQRGAWEGWLKQQQLPIVSPDGALEVLQLLEQAYSLRKQQIAVIQRTDEIRRQQTEFEEQAAQLFGGVLPAGELALALETRYERLKQQKQVRLEREALQEQLEALEAELSRLKLELDQTEASTAGLYAETGASTSEQLRRHVREQQRWEELSKERSQLMLLVASMVSTEQQDRLLEESAKADPLVLEEALREEQERIAGQERHLAVLQERKGRLLAEREALEQGEAYAETLQLAEETRTQLEQHVRRWATLAFTRQLFKKTREFYEQERQPAVLRRASVFFAEMTNGKYIQVFAPLGEKRLEVLDTAGVRLDSGVLSRGTAEQLYLAMRFALVEEMAGRGLALPLMLDDILVNFDADRLHAALRVMNTLAGNHQLLLFTCHDHVRRAAELEIPALQQIPV
ncbi:AAA family ATPase [Paenibacillus sp. y28]|uniref:AAA family ATPase n=1 Tax=Paenibacillus sp. y28 TaxID=3129110 RepID=UPI00301B3F9C